MPVRLFAPLKINLALRVVGQNDNGYHLLSSLVVMGDDGDNITIDETKTDTTIKSMGDFIHQLDNKNNNSIHHTIRICEKITQKKFHGDIILEKKIPIGSGLGGGTSDGVAMAKYLIKKWHISPPEQKNIVENIGADAPALFYGLPCLVSGIGEKITPITLPDWFLSSHLLLVSDKTTISTRDIFAKFASANQATPHWDKPFINKTDINNIKNWQNSLTTTTLKHYPHLQNIIDKIKKQTGCQLVNMTGSGSCFYGLFDTHHHRTQAIKKLQDENFWVMQVKPIITLNP
ncbi:MAG: 4-(cytidine 5'-diphospho)-2-C-methyl-D-erythritol kinase [Alphaproteobacteria bacterium]